MAKLFNCTPKPAMLRSVQNERWNVTGSLAELLDNSFGAGRGNATSVTIFHDPAARTLTVLDNGRGMDAIGRLFQHGNSIGHSIGDIGEYGAGGTKALLWLASKVSIWTLREQMVQHDHLIWKNWFNLDSFDNANVSNDWQKATSSNTPSELLAVRHGTLIRMHLLPTRSLRVNNTVRDLARFYSTGLRKGRHISWVTCRRGTPVELLTSAWLWVYLIVAYGMRAMSQVPPLLNRLSKVLDFSGHPVRSIGYVAAAVSAIIVGVGTLLIALV